jgi:hypothetical protein
VTIPQITQAESDRRKLTQILDLLHQHMAEHGEEFRPVNGWPGYYVSSNGRVYSTSKPGRFLKPWGVGRKLRYLVVKLYRDDGNGGREFRKRKVAHLVAFAFHGPRPERHDIDHIDADTKNNRADNLRYLTITENRGQGTLRRKQA